MIPLMFLLALYLLTINVATWAYYWHDKQQAIRGHRRVPELRLLTLAALGGTLAATRAQRFYRHKTQKQPFRTHMYRIRRWQRRFIVMGGSAAVIVLAQIYLSSAA